MKLIPIYSRRRVRFFLLICAKVSETLERCLFFPSHCIALVPLQKSRAPTGGRLAFH